LTPPANEKNGCRRQATDNGEKNDDDENLTEHRLMRYLGESSSITETVSTSTGRKRHLSPRACAAAPSYGRGAATV